MENSLSFQIVWRTSENLYVLVNHYDRLSEVFVGLINDNIARLLAIGRKEKQNDDIDMSTRRLFNSSISG